MKTVVECVYANQEEIDKKIEANLKGWKLSRIPKVSLSILRVAIYEMLYEEGTDVGVAINEAVELAKTYGGEKDSSFINGLLGSVARQLNQ